MADDLGPETIPDTRTDVFDAYVMLAAGTAAARDDVRVAELLSDLDRVEVHLAQADITVVDGSPKVGATLRLCLPEADLPVTDEEKARIMALLDRVAGGDGYHVVGVDVVSTG